MLRLKFWKPSPIEKPEETLADLILVDGDVTTAATVAVLEQKSWFWRVTMTEPTAGAGFDQDVFERRTLKEAKREIAARLFIAVVGCRDADSVRGPGVRRIA